MQLFDVEGGTEPTINIESWNHKETSFWRKFCFQFWYGIRDLFPIKSIAGLCLRPPPGILFSPCLQSSYYYAERWIISGYGIFNGVKNYLSKVLTDDIFANRLCAVIAPDSKVKEIDDNLLKELRDVLGQIVETGVYERFMGILPWQKNKPAPRKQSKAYMVLRVTYTCICQIKKRILLAIERHRRL